MRERWVINSSVRSDRCTTILFFRLRNSMKAETASKMAQAAKSSKLEMVMVCFPRENTSSDCTLSSRLGACRLSRKAEAGLGAGGTAAPHHIDAGRALKVASISQIGNSRAEEGLLAPCLCVRFFHGLH